VSLFNTESTAELRISRQGPAPLPNPPKPGATLDILISDALTRYWILARPEGLAGTAELDLYAADRFNAIFGDDPAEWVLRVDPLPRSSHWLACAVPSLFAVDLPRSAADRGWQVRRIQPRFVRDFNHHCAGLPRDAAFCVASSESTTIGLIADGNWRDIRVHPPLGRTTASFDTLLRRDCRQAGMTTDGLRPVVVGSQRGAAR
jgi:hypothetical protein